MIPKTIIRKVPQNTAFCYLLGVSKVFQNAFLKNYVFCFITFGINYSFLSMQQINL